MSEQQLHAELLEHRFAERIARHMNGLEPVFQRKVLARLIAVLMQAGDREAALGGIIDRVHTIFDEWDLEDK